MTRETIQIVTTCYPETMGHCVIYQPPYVFSVRPSWRVGDEGVVDLTIRLNTARIHQAFFDSVRRFIDKRTASKIIMLTGTDRQAGRQAGGM